MSSSQYFYILPGTIISRKHRKVHGCSIAAVGILKRSFIMIPGGPIQCLRRGRYKKKAPLELIKKDPPDASEAPVSFTRRRVLHPKTWSTTGLMSACLLSITVSRFFGGQINTHTEGHLASCPNGQYGGQLSFGRTAAAFYDARLPWPYSLE